MKRVGHLFEEVVCWQNLLAAAREAAKGKTRKPEVARFLFHLETELFDLQEKLLSRRWRPAVYHGFQIEDPKPRQISAAPFHDRVVHHALMAVLDPYFERRLYAHSYACRVGKGTHAAVRYAERQARRFPFYSKGDVDGFFESIDHGVLKRLLRRMLKDQRFLEVLDHIIDAPFDGRAPGRGLPIGNLTSQYFANHFLGELDHFVKRRLRIPAYLRYMDDWLLFARDKATLHRANAEVRSYLGDPLKLRLKESATWVAPVDTGIPFLGFLVFPGTIRLQGKRWRRSLKKIRLLEEACRKGDLTVQELAQSVRSILSHIQHANTLQLRRGWFAKNPGR